MLPIIFAFIIALMSISGIFFTSRGANKWMMKNMKYLVTFSAGVFLITGLNMATEAYEALTQWQMIVAIVFGFIFMWFIHLLLPEFHHHHDSDCHSCSTKTTATKLLVGDSIHNIADGIVLMAAFNMSTSLGIVASISILIHEFIQEVSEYFVYRSAGYSNFKALSLNFLSAFTIFIGLLIGYIGGHNHLIEGLLLAFSAGVFLHVVAHDLIPYHDLVKIHSKKAWTHIALFLLGALLIAMFSVFAPHTHGMHEHNGDDSHINNNADPEYTINNSSI